MLETPAGPVTVAADDRHVVEVAFGRHGRPTRRTNPVLEQALKQLREYFDGRRRTFDVPLKLDTTRFTERVLKKVDRIPYGRTRSYGELAASVRSPRAARAVGGAVGRNPFPIFIPCHRVLASDHKLGGFGGDLKWKRFLLRHEGIEHR